MAGPGKHRLKVTLLGELTLSEAGHALPLPASRKTRALFAYLLLAGNAVRRERLCEFFFDIPDDPRAALRWSLSKIRTMLCSHADCLIADRDRVELVTRTIDTDIDEAEALLASSELANGAPGEALDRFVELAHAAIDTPLAGLDLAGLDGYAAWLAAERSLIDDLRARLFAAAAAHPAFTLEQQKRFAMEAEALGRSVPSARPQDTTLTVVAEPATIELVGQETSSADVDQHVRYTFTSDRVRIAYACTGSGPPLVKAANWLNHLELDWSGPVWGRLFRELSANHSLIRYDERGNGFSDWEVEDLSFEAFVSDLECVVDHLGLERFPLLGISQGCAVSIEYAARHPERVSQLILLGGYAAGWRHTADPAEIEQREAVITLVRHGWGGDNPVYRQLFSQAFMPSATHAEIDWFNEFQRRTTSTENAVRFLEAFSRIDVRHRLSEVRAPTVVLHASRDQRVPILCAVELAATIPNASLVSLDTDSHIPLSREPATGRIVECIEAFLRTTPEAPLHRRHLVAPH
jgi:pimeloyl-ACP methyl ester carboxylesterase